MSTRFWQIAAGVVSLVLAGPATGEAQKRDVTQPYRVIITAGITPVQQELDRAARAGYRVVACGPEEIGMIAILEKATQPPETYRYRVLATHRVSTLEKEIHQAAAEGFRLLPRCTFRGQQNVAVMEKAPGDATRYEYLLLEANRSSTLQNELASPEAQGYAVAAMLSGLMAVLERPREVVGPAPARQRLLLATEQTSTMQKELTGAVGQGFRVVAGAATPGEVTVILEKNEAAEPVEYLLIATRKAATLEKELNEAAAQGYRVLPGTLATKLPALFVRPETVLILERPPNAPPRYHYRVLATLRTGTLQKEIIEAAQEGYRVLGVIALDQFVVLVEKPRD